MDLAGTSKGFVRSAYDNFGVYVWEMPNGQYVMDEDGNVLSINANFGDVSRMSKLAAAARTCGINEGKPSFLPGHRKVTDEEYEQQKERLEMGLVPDEYDMGAAVDELRFKANGR